MILFDPDHVTILTYPESEKDCRLRARIAASDDPKFATIIVTVEAQVRGWLAQIRRHRQTRQQVRLYGNLLSLIEFLKQFIVKGFEIVPPTSSTVCEERKYVLAVQIGRSPASHGYMMYYSFSPTFVIFAK
jgi:hypothetical protein